VLKNLLKAITSFWGPKNKGTDLNRSKPNVKIGDKIGNVTISHQYQLDKHTDFKVGESYRLGEAVVTLRASKAEVQAIIAATDKRRAEKEAKLRERAIEIMLMSPEQLKQFQLDEWLSKRRQKHSIIQGIMGAFIGRRYMPPAEEQISGSMSGQFKGLMKEVKSKEKVH
jgi:hypothetical protein